HRLDVEPFPLEVEFPFALIIVTLQLLFQRPVLLQDRSVPVGSTPFPPVPFPLLCPLSPPASAVPPSLAAISVHSQSSSRRSARRRSSPATHLGEQLAADAQSAGAGGRRWAVEIRRIARRQPATVAHLRAVPPPLVGQLVPGHDHQQPQQLVG